MTLKVLVFETREEAQAALDLIDAIAINWLVRSNAGVREGVDGSLYIPTKNKGTGEDDANGPVTRSYNPDGVQTGLGFKFWIYSLTDQKAEWSEWREAAAQIAPKVSLGKEVDFPRDIPAP